MPIHAIQFCIIIPNIVITVYILVTNMEKIDLSYFTILLCLLTMLMEVSVLCWIGNGVKIEVGPQKLFE